jgi:cytochrome b561
MLIAGQDLVGIYDTIRHSVDEIRAWGPDMPRVYHVFNGGHIATAWVFSMLILGHVVMALKHALVDHALFSRMRPRPRI